MLRISKIVLVVCVAAWGLVGAFHNVLDWNGTVGAVEAATSMATFEGGSDSWQAMASPIVVYLGVALILASKTATGLLCSVGAFTMWRQRSADAAAFATSKRLALVGCAVAIAMLFGGFIVIAESWFELWRSDVMRGPVLESAFRYAGMIALIALFVAGRDD